MFFPQLQSRFLPFRNVLFASQIIKIVHSVFGCFHFHGHYLQRVFVLFLVEIQSSSPARLPLPFSWYWLPLAHLFHYISVLLGLCWPAPNAAASCLLSPAASPEHFRLPSVSTICLSLEVVSFLKPFVSPLWIRLVHAFLTISS